MKKTIAILAAALLMAACGGNSHKNARFSSADGSVNAQRHGDQWTITDATGAEVVTGYDSMRVVEVGENGHPMTVIYYKGSEEHHLQYYSTMQLRSIGVFRDGHREGRWVYYHPNGVPQVEATFVNGKEEGPYRVLRDNGVPVYVGQYTEGRPSGMWEVYDQDGNLVEKTEY